MKKRPTVFIVLLLGFLLMASSALASPIPEKANVLRIGQIGDIRSLEPYRNATPNFLMIENLHDQLVFNERKEGFKPELAESWEVSPDFRSVKVKLRPGVVTHDGTPVNAELVKWIIEELPNQLYPGVEPFTPVFGGVDGKVDVIDDLTAVINLSEPFANMETKLSLLMLTDPDMFVRDDGALAAANEEDKVIGTGPFKMVEYEPGSHMYWEKFEDYWDRGVPKVDRIEITYFGDSASMMAALDVGEIDIAYLPPFEEVARFMDNPEFTAWVPETLGLTSILMLNPNAPGLKDRRVRQAIRAGIDRQAISDAVFEGLGLPSASPVIESNMAFTPELEVPPKGDLNKAKALMREAGNPDVTVKFTYGTGQESYRLIGEILQDQLKQLGINLELDPQERNIYIQMRTSQSFEMMPSVMAGAVHPADLTDSFVFLPANHGFFNDPDETVIQEYKDYQKWFNAGMNATTEAAAKEAWRNTLLAIKEGAWVIHLTGQPYCLVSSSKVKGITWTQNDKPSFRNTYIEE